MARGSRSEARDLSSRARILAAAQQRFASFGYRRTGIAEIARDAGVAAGTLYRYFENKEEIFRAVMRELTESWLARARDALRGPEPALERLTRLGAASVEFNRQNPLIDSVYRRDEEIIFAPLLEELHDELLRRNVAMMADVIREGIREGSLRDVDPERAAFVLFLGGDVLTTQTHYRYEDILPLYGDIVMHGLVPR
ncbi:MAG TPA: TetR family transcriptional regulator [Candidatus Binatia bacterium]|nr:TetR family transcriptional regulator [Candidatus Binatia bacterium]